MDIEWLEDFLVLSDLSSFTRAAQTRNVTQSAFSRRIRSLEDWIGIPLVDRDTVKRLGIIIVTIALVAVAFVLVRAIAQIDRCPTFGVDRLTTGIVHPETFFYPLDTILHWNRMYGPRGFTQYQCVLPRDAGPGAARSFLELRAHMPLVYRFSNVYVALSLVHWIVRALVPHSLSNTLLWAPYAVMLVLMLGWPLAVLV